MARRYPFRRAVPAETGVTGRLRLPLRGPGRDGRRRVGRGRRPGDRIRQCRSASLDLKRFRSRRLVSTRPAATAARPTPHDAKDDPHVP
ncbi:hypothetical protein SAM9427_34670 [Streptomyces sp. ETH9427]|nr:hypothetical protein SAM9427_34670 [Streptomyces sp. ETH9427]